MKEKAVFRWNTLTQRKAIICTLLATTIVISLCLFLSRYIGINEQEVIHLNDRLSGSVIRADGTIDNYENNFFPYLNKGDRLVMNVFLPESAARSDGVLCFALENCITHVSYKNTLLYEYGSLLNEQGKLLGGMLYKIAVPQKAWGNSLKIECTITENHAFSKIHDISIMPAGLCGMYPLINRSVEFSLLITTILVFTGSFFFFLCSSLFGINDRQGLFLSVFCVVLSLWCLCYNKMIFVVSDNIRFCSTAEYVLLFITPVPICLFLAENVYTKRALLLFSIQTVFFSVLAIVATVLNYTTRDYHYPVFIEFYCASAIVMLVAAIVLLYPLRKRVDYFSHRVLSFGMLFTMIVLILEIIRFNVDLFLPVHIYTFSQTFSTFALFIFIAACMLNFIIKIIEEYRAEKDRLQLQRLAYVDILTGISNRSGCYQKLTEMHQNGVTEYTLYFFDADNLKKANDFYGHDMGDSLIKYIGEKLQKVFGDYGFCGRWGGDEFIVCIQKENSKYERQLLSSFTAELDQANSLKQFPMKISVSFGKAVSTKEKPLLPKDAVDEADKKMYHAKKLSKYSRDNCL